MENKHVVQISSVQFWYSIKPKFSVVIGLLEEVGFQATPESVVWRKSVPDKCHNHTDRWSTNVNFPSMLCLEMNSVELEAAERSLVLGELVTWRRPIATRQQCVAAAGEASSASVPPTDDMPRSAWLSVTSKVQQHYTMQYNNNNNHFMALYLVLHSTEKKHSSTHTYHDHQPSFIHILHLLQSIPSSLFNMHAWQSFCTTSLQVFFGLQLTTVYSIHFFTQTLSSFRNTCPYIPSQPVLLIKHNTIYIFV